MPRRRTLAAFAAACSLLVIVFHQGPSGNGMSRLVTVFSLVEQHTFIGDRFAPLTQDKALVDGHYYSDKAPLSSYVVLPFYWLYRHGAATAPPPADATIQAANHLALVVAAAIPFGIFAALLWWRLARERPTKDSLWLALLAAFGTSVLNYGNSYFGHVLAGMFLLSSFILSLDRAKHFALAGLLAGCAVATEYPTAIGVLFILARLWRDPDRRRKIGWLLVGAVPPALLFFFHNKVITGHYLQLPYSHAIDTWKPMQTAFGLRYPHPRALWSLSLLPHRGAFFYGPLLLLLCILLWIQQRRFSLWLLAAYWIFISSYYTWEGGWCTGPRHLTPALMICLYEGVGAFARQPRFRRLYLWLGAIGVAINVVSAATEPLPSARERLPLFRIVIPQLFHGQINAHNLFSEWLGLPPHSYFVLLWGLLFVVVGLVFTCTQSDHPRASSTS